MCSSSYNLVRVWLFATSITFSSSIPLSPFYLQIFYIIFFIPFYISIDFLSTLAQRTFRKIESEGVHQLSAQLKEYLVEFAEPGLAWLLAEVKGVLIIGVV